MERSSNCGEGDERGEEGSVPHFGDQGGQEEDDAMGFNGGWNRMEVFSE